MRDNKATTIVILGVLLIFGVVGFVVYSGGKPEVEVQTAEVESEIAAVDTKIPDTPETEIFETEVTSEETTIPVTEENVVPTVKTSLASTDPSTVTLSSGDVQLIEFFAFW